MVTKKKSNIKKYPFTLKKGTKFIPILNSCGHSYAIGEVYVANRDFILSNGETAFSLGGGLNNIKGCEIYVTELNSAKALKARLEHNAKEIETLLTEKSFLEESIKMLEELDPTGKKEFDEKLLRLSYAVRKLEESSSTSNITSKAMLLQSILDL